jgi:hypothetical protein
MAAHSSRAGKRIARLSGSSLRPLLRRLPIQRHLKLRCQRHARRLRRGPIVLQHDPHPELPASRWQLPFSGQLRDGPPRRLGLNGRQLIDRRIRVRFLSGDVIGSASSGQCAKGSGEKQVAAKYPGTMPAYDRHKLYFGPHRTPAFRYGSKVECEARGEVKIVGLSDAPIPWPIALAGSRTSPVVFGPLVKAIRREAACAVAHWWGASPWLVRKWRRALGVLRWNEGDLLRKSAIGKSLALNPALKAMWAKARDPVRRAKIAAA